MSRNEIGLRALLLVLVGAGCFLAGFILKGIWIMATMALGL